MPKSLLVTPWLTRTAWMLGISAFVAGPFAWSQVSSKAPSAKAPTAKAPPAKTAVPRTPTAGPQTAAKAPAQSKAPASPSPTANGKSTGSISVAEAQKLANAQNRPGDWNQWMGSPIRNAVAFGKGIPTDWDVGQFDPDTGKWDKSTARNIKWAVPLGSQSYGNAVVANGKVLVGTNNGAGYLKRYPAEVDLGVLLCFDELDGRFLWQDSNEKLPTGRVNDWPLMGVCTSPLVEGNRLWYVTNRGELRCLDLNGFHDGKNDGPVTNEKEAALQRTPNGPWDEKQEADVIWILDFMKQLGVSQHNMCSCSVTAAGDVLFIITGNGVDDAHTNLPTPQAASFAAVDKNTGKVLWSDNSPGDNVLHGQWSSPAYAVLGGVPQVLFAGGDGWLYSFDAQGDNGKAKLLWKFDCNPKESKYTLGSRADRNHLIATPVVHDGLVYIGVGEDPEHGEGVGHLWCIDPTKRGDVSPELVFNTANPNVPIPHKRNQALVKEDGDFSRPNPNSAAIWHYANFDENGDGKIEYKETMHRTMGTTAIDAGLLFVADFSGLVHCLDAKTGKVHWRHDMLAASWGSPLIVEGRVYIGDEDGDISILKVSDKKEIIAEINMQNAVYSSPIVARNVLYIASKSYLFAIVGEEQLAEKK